MGSGQISRFIANNKKKWIENKVKNINKSKDNILVSSWIYSHPAGAVGESMIGKYVSDYYKFNQIGFILKGDIGSEVVLRSYGIDKIIYLDKNNLFLRLKFFLKAIRIINKIKSIDEFLNLENDNDLNVDLTVDEIMKIYKELHLDQNEKDEKTESIDANKVILEQLTTMNEKQLEILRFVNK